MYRERDSRTLGEKNNKKTHVYLSEMCGHVVLLCKQNQMIDIPSIVRSKGVTAKLRPLEYCAECWSIETLRFIEPPKFTSILTAFELLLRLVRCSM